MSGIAVSGYEHGAYWPAFWRAARFAGDEADRRIWGLAFQRAAAWLGLPVIHDENRPYVGPILMHAGVPDYCLGDFFRILVDRRRQDPGLDADSFLTWATATGRGLRLSTLDKPARDFLLNGGDYAHDVVDRTLDLLGRLADLDPEIDAVQLPSYMIEKAKIEVASGYLDLSGTSRSVSGVRRQVQPRIALDPYGQGVHVVLPAIGDTPDGIARWRVTVDGEAFPVQSRAMWPGAAETVPETLFPLEKPVRSVAVSLSEREDLAAELAVVDPADPVLFFGSDGRRLSGAVSLPRTQTWALYPADQDLQFTGDAGPITDLAIPFGWEGWRLQQLSLECVQSVGLPGKPRHSVESHCRPRLLLEEPVPGATTPFGSPVYSVPPRLKVPDADGVEITWHAEIRRAGDIRPLVSQIVRAAESIDIWAGVPKPVLGSFEVTVRGPLGRGLRRTIFVAEGLSATFLPQARLLAGTGLASGKATMTSAIGATVHPQTLRFDPDERDRPIEYRTADESEPIIITPPHAAVMCASAGVPTWTTSVPYLAAEEFRGMKELLVRLPDPVRGSQLELVVHVRGEQVQMIPASGRRSADLTRFDLTRAADTIANAGRAELTVSIDGELMPVARVRPRRLATGVELEGDKLVFRDAAVVDGLTAGVYPVYAPWRPPAEVEVAADGIAVLPAELREAGPLRVVLRIEDPWIVSSWPTWPATDAYTCEAVGVPASVEDPDEEALSRFVAGVGEMPEVTGHLGWLWRLVVLAPELVKAGARIDLAAACKVALRVQGRVALLALADEELGQTDVVHALIAAGFAASPLDETPWTFGQKRVLERLWAGLPGVAALASGDIFKDDEIAEAAIAQCGDSLMEIFDGHADPHSMIGRFGPDAERLVLMTPEQIVVLWQAAYVVPRSLLDADTRLAAAKQLFDARNKYSIRAIVSDAKMIAHLAEGAMHAARQPGLANAITARKPSSGKGGWYALPAMSIGMALVARLAARGNVGCKSLERAYRSKWVSLASEAPDFAVIDLVLAESLVSASFAEERHTPENPE